MTVDSYLRSLSSELVLSQDEKDKINRSISTLKTRLDSYFGSRLQDQFQFGSSTRGTILPRKADKESDVDYMVVFKSSFGNQKKPQAYLDRLRRFAEDQYSRSEIHQSSPTIVLELSHIKFELVPAIKPYNGQFKIPSPPSDYKDWISTDPSGTKCSLDQKNKQNEYKIKPLIRLVKYWNASQGYPYYSYLLEKSILGKIFFTCSSLSDHFYKFWSGFNSNYSDPQYIQDKVERAKRYAKNAEEYERQGDYRFAENEIKKIVPEL